MRTRTHLSWHNFVFATLAIWRFYFFKSFQLNGQMIVFLASISLVVHMYDLIVYLYFPFLSLFRLCTIHIIDLGVSDSRNSGIDVSVEWTLGEYLNESIRVTHKQSKRSETRTHSIMWTNSWSFRNVILPNFSLNDNNAKLYCLQSSLRYMCIFIVRYVQHKIIILLLFFIVHSLTDCTVYN